LIGSRVIEYAWNMAFDDDNYVLDADGNSVLIGLTLDETREFEGLDELISGLDPMSPVSTDDGRSLNERRWLVLYEKHEAAVRTFSTRQKTKH
jgi:hypothetical protein